MPGVIDVSPQEFEALVAEALDDIPGEFQRYLDNTLVTIEERPTRAQLDGLGITGRRTLLGLYQGTPLTLRDANFAALPDTIVLFREPILWASRSRTDVVRQVRDTVVHEIGHFFGLSDKDLP
ncbi:MAG TPA: metallopeptidase family protein [Thermoanaerobaculia bacterium]|jgi:predicted Zn-dependent protease with MMP-like domain|nr:metallopeptidase family protein [Thermoanaerobaculia bacterium]